MATTSIPQKPSYFPEEWEVRFGPMLTRLLDHWRAEGLDTAQIEERRLAFYAAAPQFTGIATSPSLAAAELAALPPLIPGDPLWIDAWFGEPPQPVRQVIPIPQHRVVVLVTDTGLLVLRADELAQALGTHATEHGA